MGGWEKSAEKSPWLTPTQVQFECEGGEREGGDFVFVVAIYIVIIFVPVVVDFVIIAFVFVVCCLNLKWRREREC